MGLCQSPKSPCIFFGSLVEGGPPIYVGIYVDDIIYFSSSNEVEHHFESMLSKIGEVDFMGQVSHFLGIEFTSKTLPNDNLCVTLTQQFFIESLLDSLDIIIEGTSLYSLLPKLHLYPTYLQDDNTRSCPAKRLYLIPNEISQLCSARTTDPGCKDGSFPLYR